jgi:hypothetical protein
MDGGDCTLSGECPEYFNGNFDDALRRSLCELRAYSTINVSEEKRNGDEDDATL